MENLEELASLQNHVKELALQDKLGTQFFHENIKKVFEPVTDTGKQTARKTMGAVEDTTRAIELKEDENNTALNEKKT